MSTLRLFSVFHLNLAFSSIEEDQRALVIDRCYWPLLDLVRRRGLPLGIEAPGYTLEAIEAIDPGWIASLRELIGSGGCEFVGSGYAQLIGPLVPAALVAANLRLGQETYRRLLGLEPSLALVNEQAYSASLVQHYLDAGYRALVMEWDNPYSAHPEWSSELRHLPQRAVGQNGATIPVLWNRSIAFQKFQRYAHGELELEEHLDYLRRQRGRVDRVFSLYGSDAEVFDFRPGRYRTEAPLGPPREWRRIEGLFDALASEPGIVVGPPSAALAYLDCPGADKAITLESPEAPIPVKKQPKYHIARWAVSGRDDLGINTACWRAYQQLRADDRGRDADWRELCYLWSSDFRTHITDQRWKAYRARLDAFQSRLGARGPAAGGSKSALRALLPPEVELERSGRYLTLATASMRLRLNCRRGLAIDALTIPALSEHPLIGSLPHGYFDDIEWSADQYTGFLVLAAAGQPQVTDLEPVEPSVGWDERSGQVMVRGRAQTPLGPIRKEIAFSIDRPRVSVRYRLDWPAIPLGTLRLGHVTLIPTSFDEPTLFMATHNGGVEPEVFQLGDAEVDHLPPVSHLVSCRSGLGATEGVVVLGDARRALRIELDRTEAALLPLLTMRRIGARFFCRITLSARELDDTSRFERRGRSALVDSLGFAITPASGL